MDGTDAVRIEGTMSSTRRARLLLAALIAAVAVAMTACVAAPPPSTKGSDLPQGDDPVSLDPADFTTEIDHPYWPMEPGTRWSYVELDPEGGELTVEVTVTSDTKTDRERHRGARRPRHRAQQRRDRRGHLRLVRPGRRRRDLVPRRGHRGVRGRRDRLARGLVRGRRRRRPAGHRPPGRSGAGHGSTGRSTPPARPKTTERS